ncbi:hypothetical protein WR25_01279 [Diploscapter pachys]|uniref:Uncharacterized protein n=1 Tax=Diploscapter pachys TaxID=2018661 RepID=A0A2A2LXV6_9BILA|nr:hypothetical protein WR25_01279 [Diploscapter pachys]
MATIGIDLGTTFSCVAIVGPQNEPEPIPNNFGNRIMPSVVAYDPRNPSVLIGETAQNAAVMPTNVIYDAKRMIGRQFNDKSVQDDKKLWPFEVVEKEGKPHVKLTHNGNERLISPEEISSSVLKEIKAIAEHYLGKSIIGAVITVPAYFNHRQRAETMKAAELAGLIVLRLINEPTAAAIAYGQKDNLDGKTVMIYDLGGGTFDVSIVKGEAKSLHVISIAGHNHLGYRINPDEAVALGASLLADDLDKYPDIEDNVKTNKGGAFQNDVGIVGIAKNSNSNPPKDRHNYTCNIRDIIPLSIGLGLRGGKFLRVIERFQEYPCEFEEPLFTAYDNQNGSVSGIYEGESANIDNNVKFGEVMLKLDGKNTKRGYPLKVTFEIDINGILNVTKEEVKTGKKAEIQMRYDGKAHSEDDVEKIVEEAKRHEREDKEFLELIEKRDLFEDQIYDIKANLENQPGKEEAMKLIRKYLNWSDKLPKNIAEYDPKLEEFNREISQHL